MPLVLHADEPKQITSAFDSAPDISDQRLRVTLFGIGATGANFIGAFSGQLPLDPTSSHQVQMDETLLNIVREAMEDELRDPFSAEYRGMTASASEDELVVVACGEVNAKNGFGGYVGYTPFIAAFTNPHEDPSPTMLAAVARTWITDVCKRIRTGGQ